MNMKIALHGFLVLLILLYGSVLIAFAGEEELVPDSTLAYAADPEASPDSPGDDSISPPNDAQSEINTSLPQDHASHPPAFFRFMERLFPVKDPGGVDLGVKGLTLDAHVGGGTVGLEVGGGLTYFRNKTQYLVRYRYGNMPLWGEIKEGDIKKRSDEFAFLIGKQVTDPYHLVRVGMAIGVGWYKYEEQIYHGRSYDEVENTQSPELAVEMSLSFIKLRAISLGFQANGGIYSEDYHATMGLVIGFGKHY